MFEFDKSKVPDVKFLQSWDLEAEEGEKPVRNFLYQAGDWTFETPGDDQIDYAEGAIYAWISWLNFLKQKDGV